MLREARGYTSTNRASGSRTSGLTRIESCVRRSRPRQPSRASPRNEHPIERDPPNASLTTPRRPRPSSLLCGKSDAACELGGIQRDCDSVQIVVEQVSIRVESHRSGGVTQHPLNSLDVCTGRDCERRRSVTEVVECEVRREETIRFSGPPCRTEEPAVLRSRCREVVRSFAKRRADPATCPRRVSRAARL